MTGEHALLDSLRQRRPEWKPWLDIVSAVDQDLSGAKWDRMVPVVDSARATSAPVLAGASFAIDAELTRSLFDRLLKAARSSGSDNLVALSRQIDTNVDLTVLLIASVRDDREHISRLAGRSAPDIVQAFIALFSMPFLQACRRRYLPHVAESWTYTSCPICAAWPAFVEVRGIERSRSARCGRCGAEWSAPLLKCLYCSTADHTRLHTLVPHDGLSTGAVEACGACGQYTKTLTTLQGCAPAIVYAQDLATVDLDLAALDAGYVRPHGLACHLDIRAHQVPARRSAWWRTS
jgi:FdhE protein